jgi:hypothetical protein
VIGSIMNASAVIAPNQPYQFIPDDVAILEDGLPGPGRGGSPQLVAPLTVDDDGQEGDTVVVCGCCRSSTR